MLEALEEPLEGPLEGCVVEVARKADAQDQHG